MFFFFAQPHLSLLELGGTVDGRNPAPDDMLNTYYLRWVLYITGGCLGFLNHQQYLKAILLPEIPKFKYAFHFPISYQDRYELHQGYQGYQGYQYHPKINPKRGHFSAHHSCKMRLYDRYK